MISDFSDLDSEQNQWLDDTLNEIERTIETNFNPYNSEGFSIKLKTRVDYELREELQLRVKLFVADFFNLTLSDLRTEYFMRVNTDWHWEIIISAKSKSIES